MRRYLIAILLLLSPVVAYADLTYKQLEDVSKTPENLEGRFTQEKYLAALDAALPSSGVFSYQRGKSIRWETLKPIQNELVMTPTSIVNKQGDNELMRMEMKSNPVVTLFNEIFFSVLTAEWEKLSVYFKLSGEIKAGQWKAELIPIDELVKQAVTRVELKGDELVREIILYENAGDRTTIHFNSLSL